jgi:hypothetical protein
MDPRLSAVVTGMSAVSWSVFIVVEISRFVEKGRARAFFNYTFCLLLGAENFISIAHITE